MQPKMKRAYASVWSSPGMSCDWYEYRLTALCSYCTKSLTSA
ncbi:hypothetical protein ACFY8L_03655 [Streptomyces californicus]